MASFTFTGPGGVPATKRFQNLKNAAVVTVGDGIAFGQIIRARIIDRTQRAGVDVNNAPLAPYSDKHPYYYYPGGSGAGRTARITGGKRTRAGIKYPSYRAFKQALGRSGVDLTGPRAPHMLQALVVKAQGLTAGPSTPQANSQTQPCSNVEIGFYGQEAARARGHNEGAGKLPKRRFFAASQEDLRIGAAIIAGRVRARANA